MAVHYNVRVTVEKVTTTEAEMKYNQVEKPATRSVLELVEFKTQRPTVESAAKAAIGAINLAVVEAEDS